MIVKFRNTENPYVSKEYVVSHNVTGIQKRVIVHCILYYVFERQVLSDAEYDELAKQLEQLQNKLPQRVLERTKFWYCLKDFDSSTGFDLFSKLKEEDKKRLTREAEFVLAGYEKQKGRK